MMAGGFCRKCGAPLSEGARMCKYCLSPVADGGETGPDGEAAVGEGAVGGDAVEAEFTGADMETGAVGEGTDAGERMVVGEGTVGTENGADAADRGGSLAAGGSMESGIADGSGGNGMADGRKDSSGNSMEKVFEKENAGYAGRNPYIIYGVLAYFGIAVLVPIIFKMNVKFVRFHVNQGLVLFILESLLSVAYGFVGGIPILAMVVSLLRLLCVAFMLLGAISALRGKEKPLPLVGKIHLIRES